MRKLKNEELERMDVTAFKEVKKLPVIIVLDNIRSMHNVGSAFRTSDAFLIEKIILVGITAQPPHREIHKAALGATESVEWEYVASMDEAVANLKKDDWKIVAIEQADLSTSLEEFEVEKNKKYALVFGNEVFGVSDSLMDLADYFVEIPQFGTKHSLNVSVSIGVVIWDVWKKLNSRG